MARYFFHIHDGKDYPDTDGAELPSLHAAKTEAVRLAAGLVGEVADHFWNHREWTLRVTDDKGLTLFQLVVLGLEGASAGPIGGCNPRIN